MCVHMRVCVCLCARAYVSAGVNVCVYGQVGVAGL